MKKFCLIVFLVVLLVVCMLLFLFLPVVPRGFGSPVEQWRKTYGPHGGSGVIQTADGGYAIIGSTATWNIHGYNNYMGVLIKTDSLGEVQWVNNYGSKKPMVVQLDDFSCLLNSIDPDSYGFIKVDVDGQEQWRNIYGPYGSVSRMGIQTSDGGFLLVYLVEKDPWHKDVFLVRVDSGGCELWSKTLGTESNIYGVFVSGVVATDDGGFALAGGWSQNGFWVDTGFWLAIYDFFGNLCVNNYYHISASSCGVTTVARTSDCGYILAGGGKESGTWLVKVDSLGVEQWRRHNADMVCFGSIKQTVDGGFVVGNYSMLLKFNALGYMQWKISLGMEPRDVLVTSDGGYVLTGNIRDTVGLIKIVSASGSPDASNTPNNNTMLTLSPALTAALIAVIMVIGVIVVIFYFKKYKHSH